MILVDTNVIIDFWDKPTEEVKKVFEENEIAVCGVVKTELLRGSSSEEQFSLMENSLQDFRYLTFSENDWVTLATQFICLKQNGLVVPFQDVMIACLAIKNNCEVWTNDKHFRLMKDVLTGLRLFEGFHAA